MAGELLQVERPGWQRVLAVLFFAALLANGVYVLFFSYSHGLARTLAVIPGTPWFGDGSARDGFDGDFRYYMGAAEMLRDGNPDIYRYDVELHGDYGLKPWSTTYPPTFYFLISPLAGLPGFLAQDLWLLARLLAMGGTAVILYALCFSGRKNSLAMAAGVAVIFFAIFTFSPVMEDVKFGQVNVHLLFLLCLALYLASTGRDFAAGAVLGLVFCVKLVSLLMIVYFVMTKRWRVAAGAVTAISLIGAATALFYGPGIFADYVMAFSAKARYFQENYQSQSLSCLLMLTFQKAGWAALTGPETFRRIFLLAGAVISITSLGVLLRDREPADSPRAFGLLIIATILISPIITPPHHAWLLLPFACLGGRLVRLRRWGFWSLMILAYVIVLYFSLAALDGSNVYDVVDQVAVRGAGVERASFAPVFEARKVFLESKLPLFATIFLWVILAFGAGKRGTADMAHDGRGEQKEE